jgi:hypothetical protein
MQRERRSSAVLYYVVECSQHSINKMPDPCPPKNDFCPSQIGPSSITLAFERPCHNGLLHCMIRSHRVALKKELPVQP